MGKKRRHDVSRPRNSPLVSCICPTYNRPPTHQHLLEEAIESFLRQTYPHKELIVLNDCPDQELVCKAPGVRVVNVPARFPTMGEKRNAAHRLARGELFAPWDDDDISLPWRLSLLVQRLGGADYLNPDKCWFMNSNGFGGEPFIDGVYPKAIFTRRAFEAVGGYPAITFQEDVALETALATVGRPIDPASRLLQQHEWYYIYRDEVSPIHVSSSGDDSAYAAIGALPVKPGRYVLRPRWRMDYVEETRRLISAPADHDTCAPGPGGRAGALSSPVVYVLGGADFGPGRNPAPRHFPLVVRQRGQSKGAHLAQVAQLIDEAMAAGGTHLLVPRQHAAWLSDHPCVADDLATRFDLAEVDAGLGIVFALRDPEPAAFAIEVAGWTVIPGPSLTLEARRTLRKPRVALRPTKPIGGPLHGQLVLAAAGLRSLRFGFRVSQAGRAPARKHAIVLSLDRPASCIHTLPYVETTYQEDGSVRVEFDLDLELGQTLDRVRIDLVEEDNWRLHPAFPGGESFALPIEAPAGARLDLRDLSLVPAGGVRRGPPHGHGSVPAPHPASSRDAISRRRDAVIFSSWVPEAGLALGDFFIEGLLRYHADSRIFVGINHGSSPEWARRLAASGLEVTIHPAPPSLTMSCDPAGFVAALDAYRRHEEEFDLVWFGHTKGMGHLDDPRYATSRWMIERMFWSRRAEIERYFADPVIGLYAPHYVMMTQSHLRQTDALRRMYPAPCMPLGVAALTTHFVMRDACVRDFCAKVDRRFFRDGPEPFGGDEFFCEMGMPNVPLMQGYEPVIEPGLGGTTGPPKRKHHFSIHNDWRQNHAVVARELAQWRRDPTGFRTRHAEHRWVR